MTNRSPAAGDTVRAFLAFDIPASLKRRLGTAVGRVRGKLPPARWVRMDGLHLTVKFLGEVPASRLDCLAAGLRPALAGLGTVTVTLAGTGFFPSRSRPRVAWIGGKADGAEAVVPVVEDVSRDCGWERETRPWSLHLTLARLKAPWRSESVDRFLAWGEELALEPFACDRLVLFSSRLGPGGARYTPLDDFPLARAGG